MAKLSKQDLIDDFRRVAQQLDKRPTLSEYNEHGEYSQTPIYDRFGSFENFKDEMGFETGQQKISDQELIGDIQAVAAEIGRVPPIEVYNEHGEYEGKTPKRRWGSWNDVLQKAGFEPTDHSEHWKDTEYSYEPPEGNVKVVCDHCGDLTPKWKHQIEKNEYVYCNRRCKGKAMSEQTGPQSRAWEGGEIEIICDRCGDTREVKPAEVDNARFCSQDCMIDWRSEEYSGEKHPRFVENGDWRYYGPNWEDQAAKARSRDNHECQICGLTNEQSQEKWGEVLSVHHIVRFYDFDSYKTANQLENLLTACKQHHTLLDHDRIQPPKERVTRLNEWLAQLRPDEQPQSD